MCIFQAFSTELEEVGMLFIVYPLNARLCLLNGFSFLLLGWCGENAVISICYCDCSTDHPAIPPPPPLFYYFTYSHHYSYTVLSCCCFLHDFSGNCSPFNFSIRPLLYDGHWHTNEIWGTPRILNLFVQDISFICWGPGSFVVVIGERYWLLVI